MTIEAGEGDNYLITWRGEDSWLIILSNPGEIRIEGWPRSVWKAGAKGQLDNPVSGEAERRATHAIIAGFFSRKLRRRWTTRH